MDNFSKFVDEELEVIDTISTTDESTIEMKPELYNTSFLGNPCTTGEKTGAILVGSANGLLIGVGIVYSMTKYHKTVIEGIKLIGNLLSVIP